MATNHLLFAPQTAKVCGSRHIRVCTVFIRKRWFRAQHLPRAFLLPPPCRSQTNYNLYLTVCLRLTAASLTAYSRCRLRHEVPWTSREYALLTPQAATGLIQVVFDILPTLFVRAQQGSQAKTSSILDENTPIYLTFKLQNIIPPHDCKLKILTQFFVA